MAVPFLYCRSRPYGPLLRLRLLRQSRQAVYLPLHMCHNQSSSPRSGGQSFCNIVHPLLTMSSSSQRHSISHPVGQSQNVYLRREVFAQPTRRRHRPRVSARSSYPIAASDAELPMEGRAFRKVGEDHQN